MKPDVFWDPFMVTALRAGRSRLGVPAMRFFLLAALAACCGAPSHKSPGVDTVQNKRLHIFQWRAHLKTSSLCCRSVYLYLGSLTSGFAAILEVAASRRSCSDVVALLKRK